jgi:hypothetical protein
VNAFFSAWSYVTWFFGLIGKGFLALYNSPLTVRIAMLIFVGGLCLGSFVAGHHVAVEEWKPKANTAQTNLTITEGKLEKAVNAMNAAISRADTAERKLSAALNPDVPEVAAKPDGAPVATLAKPHKRKPAPAPTAAPAGFKFPSIF